MNVSNNLLAGAGKNITGKIFSNLYFLALHFFTLFSSLDITLGDAADFSLTAGAEKYVLEANFIEISPGDVKSANEVTIPSGETFTL